MKHKDKVLTQEVVRTLFDYVEGKLIRKIPAGTAKAGDIAGDIGSDGYLQLSINGRRYKAHRVVFLYCKGYLPDLIDHIDGNTTNNKINNLRPCTLSENQHNRKIGINNTSGVKGVSWNKRAKKWRAAIKLNGKRKYLGCFDSIDDAKRILQTVRKQMHGDFCNNG